MEYKVNLSNKADSKIKYWVNKASKEISGFGITEYDAATHEFTVTDVYLIEQTVGAAHTDISPEGMAKLLYKTRNEVGTLNFWWHSHVNMDVFWSGQDMDTILKLGGNGFIVASVFNKREEVRTAIAYVASSALNKNVPETVFYDDVSTFVTPPPLDADLVADLDKQFTDLVKDEPIRTFKQQNWPPFDNRDVGRQFSQLGFDAWDNVDMIATSNIYDATKGMNHEGYRMPENDGLTNDELKELLDPQHGAFGYGFFVEAKILGLTSKTYKRILKQNNYQQIMNLEDRLIKAEAANEITPMKNRLCKSEKSQ